MEEAREILGQIEVVVDLHPSLDRFTLPAEGDGQSFRDGLLRHLRELAADLSIPAEISLAVRLHEDELNSYSVAINDQRCRLTLPTKAPEDVTPLELAKSVAEVIYQNRELCVPAGLSERIREKWSSENGGAVAAASLSPEEFHQYLTRIIRRGFKIDRDQGFPRPGATDQGANADR
jgi:hypothetical protein